MIFISSPRREEGFYEGAHEQLVLDQCLRYFEDHLLPSITTDLSDDIHFYRLLYDWAAP